MIPSRGWRLLAAFLLAPMAAPFTLASVLLFLEVLGPRPHPTPSVGASLEIVVAVFSVGAPLAYAAALLAGGPVYLVLRWLGLVRRVPLWIAGAAIGSAVGLALVPHIRSDLFSIRFPWWAGGALGVVSAESFLRLAGGGGDRRPVVTD